MRLRPYINEKDYEYVSKWVSNERIHALWCANLIPYPLSEEGLREVLDKDARDWGGLKGLGTQMVALILKYAFDVTSVSEVRLNVFDVNISARKCYSNAGFIEESIVKGAFTYENEQWGRCHMVAAQ